jgi:two-component system sensor histidine kinase AlgZ
MNDENNSGAGIPLSDKQATEKSPASTASDFLPDLCTSQSVFLLVLVAELIALLLALTSVGLRHLNWDILALISFQVQWIALVSAALLCRLRPYLRRWSPLQAGAVSYLSVLLVTLVLSILGQWVLRAFEGRRFNSNLFAIDGWLLASNLFAAAILAGIVLRYLYLQQQLRNQQQAELQARIQALQSRIRPHFLFNSMNSIASLIATDPDMAERVVEDLSELFRASLAEPTLIPLERELTLCRHYLEIEKLRLGERLQVDWIIHPLPDDVQIPGLLLQPLLENAVFHGIEPLPKGGRITIEVLQKEKQVVIKIANPVPLAAQQPLSHSPGRHNRMARDNIRHRLYAHYGAAARLSNVMDSGTFTTLITYPLDRTFVKRKG